ncbi:hypothetical protein [Kineococcus rhizosphaerae]|uniref:Uncharacterized protein n=1 Tax=Kineococcus rhizosphaerae TaxID=559628 RepID=A0A2T0R2Z9_9ACTN|nr:hypothetical protein [Kineococcus rhizosphaerae]PRY14141.1 hypothetical protein CLV37_107260 [Kineococcus rhizosphaerae]
MDERLSGWEDRLRHELDVAVGEVRADEGLVVAARAGGRRRLRRRRALVSLPAAALVAGGAVWAGTGRSAPPAPAAPAQTTTAAVPDPAPTPDPGLTPDPDQSALDEYFAAGYDYDDAVRLGKIWNVDFYEAKIRGGRELIAGQTLPVAP